MGDWFYVAAGALIGVVIAVALSWPYRKQLADAWRDLLGITRDETSGASPEKKA
jgi:hypothetical protein